MLSIIQRHLLPPTLNGVTAVTNPVFSRVASPDEMSDQGVKDLVDINENGLLGSSALGGGGSTLVRHPPPQTILAPVLVNGKRSMVRSTCSSRRAALKGFAVIVRPAIALVKLAAGDVAHIIAYSANDQKGIDFWRLVELFRGVEATVALKAGALPPNPESVVDTMKNVWFLCKACRDAFGRPSSLNLLG